MCAQNVFHRTIPKCTVDTKKQFKISVLAVLRYAGLASWLEGGAGPAPPSSFVEEGVPNSFADIGAKLKALQEKTKVELSKLQSDTAPPSSFGEDFDNGLISAEQGTNMLKRLMGPINDHLRMIRESDVAGPSSLMSDLNPAYS